MTDPTPAPPAPLTADRTCPQCHRLVSYQGHAEGCDVGRAGVTREAIVSAVIAELGRAQAKFEPIASGHEAIGVVGEEWDEFELAIKWGVDHRGRPADPRVEAIQLAAMAIRYLYDVGGLPDAE